MVDSSQQNVDYLKVMNDGSSSEDRPACMRTMDLAANKARLSVLERGDQRQGLQEENIRKALDNKGAVRPISSRIKTPPR